MSQSEIKAITEEVKNAKSMEEIYYIVKRCTGKEKHWDRGDLDFFCYSLLVLSK